MERAGAGSKDGELRKGTIPKALEVWHEVQRDSEAAKIHWIL